MQLHREHVRALALVVASVFPAREALAQSLIRELFGRAAGDQLGASVAELEDVDGDGIDDLAVGSPGPASALGNVRVLSGADGRELWEAWGTLAGARFAQAIAGVGDVNGDGRGDLAVGAHLMNFAGTAGAGEIRLFSGADGALVRAHRGDSAGDHFGWSLAGAGDVDLDGVPDYVAGAIDDDNAGASSGSARVFSGASGAVLFTANGSAAQQLFGYSVAGVGDVDGDSIPDLLVGARQLSSGASGYARVLSGATGLVVHHLAGASTDLYFGTSLASAGDVDFDGRGDFIVGTPDAFDAGARSGVARLYSGALAAVLFELRGATAGMRLGSSLAGGLDLTGEGVSDLLLGAPGDPTAGVSAGAAYAFTGSDALPPSNAVPLTGDVAEVSRAAHESQSLALDAGVEQAGLRYRILGSMNGSSPGMVVDGIALPLNPDRYLRYLSASPVRGPLRGGSGTLDAQGRASATFTPLRQWSASAVVGRTFHHAYLVLSSEGRPVFASNAVAVTLVP